MNITLDDIVRRITELATENPDHVYQMDRAGRCANVHESERGGWEPGCIVGKALIDLGVEPEWFVRNALVESGIVTVVRRMGLNYSRNPQLNFIVDVQDYQDEHNSWGHALKKAQRNNPEVIVPQD